MRYSVPERLMKLIWEDDEFFNAACKNGGISINRFPKNDQWVDEDGFHIIFALAGYSPEDILIEVNKNTIVLSSNGIQEISPEKPEIKETDDAMSEYTKKAKAAIQKGAISRGIARRSFKINFAVSDLFNCYETMATIKHGLLHVVIPQKDDLGIKIINIVEK